MYEAVKVRLVESSDILALNTAFGSMHPLIGLQESWTLVLTYTTSSIMVDYT